MCTRGCYTILDTFRLGLGLRCIVVMTLRMYATSSWAVVTVSSNRQQVSLAFQAGQPPAVDNTVTNKLVESV